MPRFSYPRSVVVRVLRERFGCELSEERGSNGGDIFLVIPRPGPLQVAVLNVQPYEVLHFALDRVALDLGLNYAELIRILDAEPEFPDEDGDP